MLNRASVHGRFQPFHNGHLEYVLEAKKRAEFLWIGITKFETPPDRSPLARQRERPESNPLSYFERIEIIARALVDKGVPRGNFGFVPFPIERPDRLRYFLPVDILCFTTIYEEWNREKVRILEQYGYTVEVLWERSAKEISGAMVRSAIVTDSDEWREMVPPATAHAVGSLGLRARLAELMKTPSPE